MSDTSNNAAGSSSSIDHEDCPFHDDPREGLCHATTCHGNACKSRARIQEPGLLPVCTRHKYADDNQRNSRADLRAGRCQAISECGYTCNRLANYFEPYHFCVGHPEGSASMPCHLLQLPTELRLMVYRYLFPEVVSSDKQHGVKVAILKTNRQIHREASSVLYGESCFETVIQAHTIKLQGKKWWRLTNSKNTEDDYSVESLFNGSSAHLIRNLHVHIHIEEWVSYSLGTDSRGITHEEYVLYMFRDAVRKLVDYFTSCNTRKSSQRTLQRLKVSPEISRSFDWKSDEAVTALFLVLEPLQMLPVDHRTLDHVVSGVLGSNFHTYSASSIAEMQKRKTYTKLREQWLDVSNNAKASSMFRPHKPQPTLQSALRKLDAFAQLLRNGDLTSPRPWPCKVFGNFARPLHLARVAFENNDTKAIERIQEAIKLRWINSLQQEQVLKVENSIVDMIDNDTRIQGTLQQLQYPVELGGGDPQLLPQKYGGRLSYLWAELSTEDSAPKLDTPGVRWRTEGVRIRIRKGGQEWIRLKTPEVVRQLRSK